MTPASAYPVMMPELQNESEQELEQGKQKKIIKWLLIVFVILLILTVGLSVIVILQKGPIDVIHSVLPR